MYGLVLLVAVVGVLGDDTRKSLLLSQFHQRVSKGVVVPPITMIDVVVLQLHVELVEPRPVCLHELHSALLVVRHNGLRDHAEVAARCGSNAFQHPVVCKCSKITMVKQRLVVEVLVRHRIDVDEVLVPLRGVRNHTHVVALRALVLPVLHDVQLCAGEGLQATLSGL